MPLSPAAAAAVIRRADDPLSKFADGARDKATGAPVPLLSTRIGVRILGGLALVRTERRFRNDEARGIEVTSTFPVPVHAHLVAMTARVGGRVLQAKAQRRAQARGTYEASTDAGKTAVLHEELVRGVHMLSVGHVGPGEEVAVATTWAQPLGATGDTVELLIPTTVGEVYGRSPLADPDDLRHGPVVHEADIEVTSTSGIPHLVGGGLVGGKARVRLDAPVCIVGPGWAPRDLLGASADGRAVRVSVVPAPAGEAAIAAELLLDGSGSMLERHGGHDGQGRDKFGAMLAGIEEASASLRATDRFRLWVFSDAPRQVCSCTGDLLGKAVRRVKADRGGTETGVALAAATTAGSGGTDLLVVTDGKSHALDVQALARTGKRFTVVLIGEDALEAHIGHLAALTGGQVFVTGAVGVAEAVKAALLSMRAPHATHPPIAGPPTEAEAWIGGMHVVARWNGEAGQAPPDEDARLVGAYAACLAIPHMAQEEAAGFAVAHGLVCHLTSLVLVDEAGELHEGLPAHRQVALSTPRAAGATASPPIDWLGTDPSVGTTFVAMRRRGSPIERSTPPPPPARSPGKRRWSQPSAPPPAPATGPVAPAAGLRGALGLVDWSDAEGLRRGDLSGLSSDVATQASQAARVPEIEALGAKLGVLPTVVALALLARADAARAGAWAGRMAARFARVLLGKASEEELNVAAAVLGL